MSNRDQLLKTARDAATAALPTLSTAMSTLKTNLNSDPSTKISAPEVTAAADLIGLGQNIKLGITQQTAKDFIGAFK